LELGLTETNVTDKGLRHLHKAPRLCTIHCSLDRELITKGALNRWRKMRLKRFRQRSAEERRKEAVVVVGALASEYWRKHQLPRITLWGPSIDADLDEELEYLAEIAELEELKLEKTQITSKGLRHLSGLRRLRILKISGDFDNLDSIAGLTNLRELFCGYISDEGTAALQNLTALESLSL